VTDYVACGIKSSVGYYIGVFQFDIFIQHFLWLLISIAQCSPCVCMSVCSRISREWEVVCPEYAFRHQKISEVMGREPENRGMRWRGVGGTGQP